jgi:hypothetical protein
MALEAKQSTLHCNLQPVAVDAAVAVKELVLATLVNNT